jgi:hypothetical protein
MTAGSLRVRHIVELVAELSDEERSELDAELRVEGEEKTATGLEEPRLAVFKGGERA